MDTHGALSGETAGSHARLVIEYKMSCLEHGAVRGFPTEGSARFAVDEHNRIHHRSGASS